MWRGRTNSYPRLSLPKAHGSVIGDARSSGGLAGRVTDVGEVYLTLEIAEGTEVKVQKAAVAQVLPKGTLKSL